jgi:hypothetical protein
MNLISFFQSFPSILAAFQHVRDNLSDLNGKAGADETDLVFLKGLLASPAVTQLMKVRHKIIYVIVVTDCVQLI